MIALLEHAKTQDFILTEIKMTKNKWERLLKDETKHSPLRDFRKL